MADVSDSPASRAVPQAATSLLEPCLRALRGAAREQTFETWLQAHTDLGASARRQAHAILHFLGLLEADGRLRAEPGLERTDEAAWSCALLQRFRAGYVAAGCNAAYAGLIGTHLPARALGRILEGEPPFQRLENPPTRRNALRFAEYVHVQFQEAQVEEAQLQEALSHAASPPQSAAPPSTPAPDPTASPTPPANSAAAGPVFHDLGTTLFAEEFRVGRVGRDGWVSAKVQFEGPPGTQPPLWLSPPDPAERARWLENLAADLLDAADKLRQAHGT